MLHEVDVLLQLQLLSHLSECLANRRAREILVTVICLVLMACPEAFELVIMTVLLCHLLSVILLYVPVLLVSDGVPVSSQLLELILLGAAGHVLPDELVLGLFLFLLSPLDWVLFLQNHLFLERRHTPLVVVHFLRHCHVGTLQALLELLGVKLEALLLV